MYFITTKRMLEVCFFQHTPTFIIEPSISTDGGNCLESCFVVDIEPFDISVYKSDQINSIRSDQWVRRWIKPAALYTALKLSQAGLDMKLGGRCSLRLRLS